VGDQVALLILSLCNFLLLRDALLCLAVLLLAVVVLLPAVLLCLCDNVPLYLLYLALNQHLLVF